MSRNSSLLSVVTVCAVVFLLATTPTIDAVPCNCDHTDIRTSLLAFYNATSQGNATWRTPWDLGVQACYWSGVFCGGESFVISLQFDNVGMSGTIPNAALGGLKALQTLSISNEPHLVGTLPTVLATFASLVQLTLSNVNLVGTVPSFLASMSLTNLVLSNAGFNGTVPDLGGSTSLVALQLSSMPLLIGPAMQLPQSLEYLSLTFLQPHATFPRAIFALSALRTLEITSVVVNAPLPNDISNLPNLERLTVSSNQLIGTLPSSLCSLNSLAYLSLSDNGFGGSLPSFIGNLSSTLVELDIHGNAFRGALPDELSRLGNLKTLQASYNAFSGSFKASWGRMTSLTYLDLSNNVLSGTLPDAIGNITALTQIFLWRNKLSGSVDALMTLTNLVNLQLHYNLFSGAIPYSLSNLTQLKYLLLNGNTFNETLPDVFDKIPLLVTLLAQRIGLAALPPSFASLSNLQTLDVSRNRITSMSTLLCNLSKLQTLNLSGNAFEEVPTCMANLTAVVSLALNYCRMSGNLSFIANMTALSNFSAVENGFSGQLPDCFDRLPYLASFDVAQNSISGTLPATLANATRLTSLVIENNQLSGSIPQALFQLQRLGIFRAKDNMLSGGLPFATNFSAIATIDLAYNAISGTFSEGICNMASLQSFDVSWNEISGTLPDCFDSLNSLRTFNAFGNRLTGSLPRSLFNVSTLQYLMLSNNYFGGTLPVVTCHPAGILSNRSHTDVNNSESDATVCPANLATLSIAGNLLTGELPSSMFNLSALSSLDLSHNKLSGSITIPAEWSMSLLSTLILSSNALEGEPSFLSALSLLTRVDLSHNKFSGTLSLGALHALQWVDASWNKLDGLSQWPTESLTSLEFCDVSYNNKLFDRLPSLDVAPQLATFLADGNGMLGSVPQAVPLSLATLSLGANLLMGSVPFASYHNLQFLNLAGNLLTGDLCCAFLNRTFAFGTLLLNINSFSGSLPSDFSGLSQLVKFDVSQNSITGSVPSSLLQLQMLQTLNLAKNQLSGTLARFIGGQLASLNLSHNRLSGELPRINHSSSLGTLSMEVNQFVNTLPSQWASMTHLTVLRIGSNSLNGTLPPSWSSLTQLQTLWMEANSITGNLSQFSACSSLIELSLSGNRFSGVVPPDWDAALPSLRTLYLDSNAINGTLPPSLGSLSSLAVLSLGSNQLTGSVPALWADVSVWPSLSTFDISSNFLSGTLPVGLVSGATNLTVLNAASNSLAGTLPYEWFAFSSLRLLNASRNRIRGSLPRSWALLNRLETMDLSQTVLSGALPVNWGDNTSLRDLTTLLLGGHFCSKVPASWQLRAVLYSAIAKIGFGNCTASNSPVLSPTVPTVTIAKTRSAAVTQSSTVSLSATRTRSISTTPSNEVPSMSVVSVNVTLSITPSRTVTPPPVMTPTPQRTPTGTSSATLRARTVSARLSPSHSLDMTRSNLPPKSNSSLASKSSSFTLSPFVISKSPSLVPSPSTPPEATATFVPRERPTLLQIVSFNTAAAVAVGAGLSQFFSAASSTDAATLAILGEVTCNSNSASSEASQTSVLRFSLSPFYDLGYSAMVLGNIGLSVIVCLSLPLAFIRIAPKFHPSWTVESLMRLMRFPSWPHLLWCWFSPGVLFASIRLVSFPRPASAATDLLTGLLGICCCIAFVVFQWWLVKTRIYLAVYCEPIGNEATRSWLSALAMPSVEWGPEAMRAKYSTFFASMKGATVSHQNIPFAASMLFVLIASVRFGDDAAAACTAQLSLLIAVEGVLIMYLLWKRPFRAPLLTHLLISTSASLIGVAASILRRDAVGVSVFTVLQTLTNILRVVYVLAVRSFERRNAIGQGLKSLQKLLGVATEDVRRRQPEGDNEVLRVKTNRGTEIHIATTIPLTTAEQHSRLSDLILSILYDSNKDKRGDL